MTLPEPPGPRRALTPWSLAAAAASAVLLVGTAALGPSAISPDLPAGHGWRSVLPPWSLGVSVDPALVTGLVEAGYLLGAVGVGLGLWAAWRGERVPGWAVRVAVVVAVVAALVPPAGSADHVSYAAYGRITAQGGDPYTEPPVRWDGGRDPVTSAVEPPWTTTPSVYGPVATLVQAATSLVGGDSLRATVGAWQLVCLAAWLGTGLVLLRWTRCRAGPAPSHLRPSHLRPSHPDLVARAAWLWLLNPVLLGVLLVGAHVDLLAAALALAAVLLAGRRALVAGLLLGAAVGVKVTFAVVGPAVLYALWRRSGWRAWPDATRGLLGALVVLVPTWVWAGPHVMDQLSRARTFVSLATPWRPLVDALTGPVANDTVRDWVGWTAPLVILALAALLWRATARLRAVTLPTADLPTADLPAVDLPETAPSDQVALDAARLSVVLGAAYVLGAPYSLPWYDVVAWAPLALLAVPALDALLLVRLTAYASAYVPGRVVGSDADVTALMLGYRRHVVPWVGWALLLALLVLAVRRPSGPAPALAGSPRSPAG